MSGHSKWATIKRQKGVNDLKRAQIFTKLSKAISIAVKQGGNITDPEGNFRLRIAIEDARRSNMPKENVERAIVKAGGKLEANFEEAVYEGFGPGGINVIVEALTDNKQRTVATVKNVFDKNGGALGAQGSVMHQFERRGVLEIKSGEKSIDEIFLLAADAGALDVEGEGSELLIYTKPEDLFRIRSFVAEKGIDVNSAEIIYKPNNLITLTDENLAKKAIDFVEKMEELSDVQKVFVNFDIV